MFCVQRGITTSPPLLSSVCGAVVPLCKQCKCTVEVEQLSLPFFPLSTYFAVLFFFGWLWEISVTQASLPNWFKLKIHEAIACFTKQLPGTLMSFHRTRDHLCMVTLIKVKGNRRFEAPSSKTSRGCVKNKSRSSPKIKNATKSQLKHK